MTFHTLVIKRTDYQNFIWFQAIYRRHLYSEQQEQGNWEFCLHNNQSVFKRSWETETRSNYYLTLLKVAIYFFWTIVYIFDPASPHPVAVQSSVSRRSDVVSAVFDRESVLCSNKNGKSFKMSKLYFLNQEQVWENCRKFIWFLSVLKKKLTVFDWVSDAVRFCARNHDVFTKFVKLANTWAIYT